MVTAKCLRDKNPVTGEQQPVKVGEFYKVRTISMGQSFTTVYLEDVDALINSVCLKFYEDGKPLNIYGDRRFNPYL